MKGSKNCHIFRFSNMFVQHGFQVAEFFQVSLRSELWKQNEFIKVLPKLESFLEWFCHHVCRLYNNEMDLTVFLSSVLETITKCIYK